MGVYIKGMDKETAVRICAYVGLRMEDSDFIPIPEHGALMDRDDFFATCPELVDGYKHITDALIVIPTEEEP